MSEFNSKFGGGSATNAMPRIRYLSAHANPRYLETFEVCFHVQNIQLVKMKLFRSCTLLMFFEIYTTRLQLALQRSDIHFKDIFINAMLEMLL